MKKARKKRAARAPRKSATPKAVIPHKYMVMRGHKCWHVMKFAGAHRLIISSYRGKGAERNARTLCAYLRKHGE